MSLLFRILYAAHANGTHHKLALDALPALAHADGEGWRRLFLKHAAIYMRGAKAPDDEYKDFQNHVLHVRDGYWGGAIDATEEWYGRLLAALRARTWSDAVFAAGVLSHYLTDPLHPFHTGQTEAESCIHRACEWSISRSYAELRALAQRDNADYAILPGTGPAWLRELVIEGAEHANRGYEKLIAHYDINRGAVDPPAGLDDVSRRLVAELLARASRTVAVVLDRAFTEAVVSPPVVTLTLETVLAGMQIPAKVLAKRLSDAEDRRVVEAMYDELKATGTVQQCLPEDDRVVRDLHREQVGRLQLDDRLQHRKRLLGRTDAAMAMPARHQPPAPTGKVVALEPKVESEPGPTLALADDVERAPSIGPRTAERLYQLGIRTVDDLLAARAEDIAVQLGIRHVSAATAQDWQDQARLVTQLPGLRGTHAQLLVGAGYRTRAALAAASAEKLCADVLAFASTSSGQRLLRDGPPPDIDGIKRWVEGASSERVA